MPQGSSTPDQVVQSSAPHGRRADRRQELRRRRRSRTRCRPTRTARSARRLRPDRQPELPGLRQDRGVAVRAGADEHALHRLRRRLREPQRRRRDRLYDRLANRWVISQFAVSLGPGLLPVRRRLERPATRPAPGTATRSEYDELPGLPEARSLAGRLLRHLQPLRRRDSRLHRPRGLRVRPRARC